MIRRLVGDEFWLITQPDHARLAAELLRHFGNARFSREYVNADVHAAVAMHDAGWAAHDAAPTINPLGSPLDVFEPPPDIALPIWQASADAAQQHSPLAGYLVSCQVLTLSTYLASREQSPVVTADPNVLLTRFALNKFQHHEFERLEKLRPALGLRTDIPTTLGIAEGSHDKAEQTLAAQIHLLQAMDLLSLALCCTKPPGDRTGPLHETIGKQPVSLQFHMHQPRVLALRPWPFAEKRLEFAVPCLAVPARRYTSDADLQATCAAANPQTLRVSVIAG